MMMEYCGYRFPLLPVLWFFVCFCGVLFYGWMFYIELFILCAFGSDDSIGVLMVYGTVLHRNAIIRIDTG